MKNPMLPFLPIAKMFMKYMPTPPPDIKNAAVRHEVLSYDHVPLKCITSLIELLEHVTVPLKLYRYGLEEIRVAAPRSSATARAYSLGGMPPSER